MKTLGAIALAGVPVLASISLLGCILTQIEPAQAQAAYGSYIGIGPAIGVTKGKANNEPREVSAVVTGRYKILESPVSLRTQAFIGNGVAILPTVSYDIPLNWQTEAYIGLGAALHVSGNTPIGDKTAFAIQPGIDYSLPNSKVVLFGNAVLALDAYKTGGAAASIQGGVGWRF